MNREQRRAYERKLRRSSEKNVFICPICNHKTRCYTKKLQNHTVIACEYCDATLRDTEAIDKAFPPGIILPWPLNGIDIILKELEENNVERKSDNEVGSTENIDSDKESSREYQNSEEN